MSSEVSKQQSSVGSNLASYALFPVATTAGSAISAVKTHGIKGLKKAQNGAGFDALDKAMKNKGVDVFTRSSALSNGYDRYVDFAKQEAKAPKKLEKLAKKLAKKQNPKLGPKIFEKTADVDKAKNAKIAVDESINNIANSEIGFNQTTAKKLDEALGTKVRTTFADADTIAKSALKEGAETATKSALKANAKGFAKSIKTNFKAEVGWKNGKFNYFMTALQFFPNVINEVIPTFKEEGFVAGMKATGKTLIRGAADLLGYAAGGSVGRTIGSAIGLGVSFISRGLVPKSVATRVGGNVGDMIGSMILGGFVTKKVDKMVGADENAQIEANQTQLAQDTSNTAQIQQAQAPQQVEATQQNADENLAMKYANMPSKHEVKQAAYAQAFQGQRAGRFNSYMA
ncbi:MAG: hypothetical protein IJZ27_04170 [Treponema sp.]|nr:hypothetical protein [Treponema sp.]